MNRRIAARTLALPALLAALSACSGTSFEPNTTTEAQFESVLAAQNALAPSSAPLFGSATYEGEVQIDTMGGTTKNGSIRGDLIMDVSFTNVTSPFSVEAGGFAGTIDGKRVTYSGTLSSDDAPGILPLNYILPIGEDGTSTMWVTIGGTLKNDDTGVRNRMRAGTRLTGDFRGTKGSVITGDAQMVINPRGGVSAITGTSDEATVTGAFYAISND